ncbi:MAG: HAMP domain-containing sensor histidine kinase [Pirellulaceae bacterium]
MSTRRNLRWPISLGVSMIVLLVALTVGWIVLAVFGLLEDGKRAPIYVTLLSVGTTFLVLVLVGTILYLALSVKAINLTRRQSNFIDSVTHELKSPIASLKLYLQTLVRRSVSDEQRENFYGLMLDDVERLDHLINHLLDAGRVDREPTERDHVPIELADLLRSAARAVCLRYRLSDETIRMKLQPCQVTGSRVDLDMAFRNLLDNAIKYAGSPPEVHLDLRLTANGSAEVHIRDNGTGIPRHLRRKIFGRFVRLGSELQREKPGTGLGLYIVRQIVSRMKGKVQIVDGDQLGGAEFLVTLPGAVAVST